MCLLTGGGRGGNEANLLTVWRSTLLADKVMFPRDRESNPLNWEQNVSRLFSSRASRAARSIRATVAVFARPDSTPVLAVFPVSRSVTGRLGRD